jgi:hypothetical protein
MDRLWPDLTSCNYEDILMRASSSCSVVGDEGASVMCSGLCKNLATLSQMSLDRISNSNFPQSSNNDNEPHFCANSIPGKLYESQTSPLNHKPPTGKQLLLREPPILTSPDFTPTNNSAVSLLVKSPPVPKPRVSSLPMKVSVKAKRPEVQAVSGSDIEQESLLSSIPPMQLIDVNQIKNNCNPIDSSMIVSSPKVQKMKFQPHPGCGHNHQYQQQQVSSRNESSSGSPSSSQSIRSESSRLATTPPSSPSLVAVVPIQISESKESCTSSPSKSNKSRKIAKFFRSRSKSPKTLTSAGDNSKLCKFSSSSASSCSSSGASSSSSGATLPPTKSPKHQNKSSPSKNNSMKVHSCFSTATNNLSSISSDYQFTCDSALPAFLPNPMLKPV